MALVETARLCLRELRPQDLDALAAVYADPETMRFVGQGRARSRAETAERIAWHRRRYREDGYGVWGVERRACGTLIGSAGLLDREIDGRRELELACVIARAHWGCGYGCEVARAIRDLALGVLGAARLVALVDHGNSASAVIARRIGMRHERTVLLASRSSRLFAIERAPLAA
jgi:RimJ/RimL family protein N-acetyltransferase